MATPTQSPKEVADKYGDALAAEINSGRALRYSPPRIKEAILTTPILDDMTLEQVLTKLKETQRCEIQLAFEIKCLKERITTELGFDIGKPQLECWHLAAQVRQERDTALAEVRRMKQEMIDWATTPSATQDLEIHRLTTENNRLKALVGKDKKL